MVLASLIGKFAVVVAASVDGIVAHSAGGFELAESDSVPPNIRHLLEDQRAGSDRPHVKASSQALLLVFVPRSYQLPCLGLGLRSSLVAEPLR